VSDRTADYAIITPAYNEAAYIAGAIETVVAQTVRPVVWVIVDDGSVDDTPSIIEGYQRRHDWIVYVRRQKVEGQSYFASNVYAIMDGYRELASVNCDFVGVLDADIMLPRDYYELIIGRFVADERLGVASGVYENLINGQLCPVLSDRRSTPKAIQVFRRDCFAEIGGFIPLRYGGEDTCACAMARMHGWKTWSFPDIKVVHRRPTGTGNARSVLHARYVNGLGEYGMASHPLFVFFKCLRRCVREQPYGLSGIARACGFIAGYAKREPRLLPAEVRRFVRREQLARICTLNRLKNRKGLA